MKVTAIKCPKCGDTIFSRANHDYHNCTCRTVAIDGGPSYIRCCWDPTIEPPEPFEIEVDATREELYQDWNTSTNKFGIIKKVD